MSRDQQLAAEVVDGRLVISVGVDALMTIITDGPDWDANQLRITDPDAFAAAIGANLVLVDPRGSYPGSAFLDAIYDAEVCACEAECAGVEDVE